MTKLEARARARKRPLSDLTDEELELRVAQVRVMQKARGEEDPDAYLLAQGMTYEDLTRLDELAKSLIIL